MEVFAPFRNYTEAIPNETVTNNRRVAAKITEFKGSMAQVVITLHKLCEDIEVVSKERGLTLEQITEALAEEFDPIHKE
jgi:hypothetical protein